MQEGLPATLVADSAAAALMAAGKVDAVVVGADRIAANGDTANKIGTYSLAVHAQHHGCEPGCCMLSTCSTEDACCFFMLVLEPTGFGCCNPPAEVMFVITHRVWVAIRGFLIWPRSRCSGIQQTP